jgi:carboxymethylenebutenolidase
MPTTSSVKIATGAGEATGYLARPDDARPRAGLVVIQEWWGLVPHIEDIARRFAVQGYVALAPDLYHGKRTVEAEEARHLMEGLDWSRAGTELAAAVGHLREIEGVSKVGVVGFCMGGALTLIAATNPAVDAYVAYYGFPPAAAAPLDSITAPGLIIFGEDEPFFSVDDARAFAERQRSKGRPTEVVVYPEAGHGFFNDDRPDVHRPSSAGDAWQRTLEHFSRHLTSR